MMTNSNNYVKIVAIIGIVILESIALYTGIDGYLFGLVMVIIGGIAGYSLKGTDIISKIKNFLK